MENGGIRRTALAQRIRAADYGSVGRGSNPSGRATKKPLQKLKNPVENLSLNSQMEEFQAALDHISTIFGEICRAIWLRPNEDL